jgi:hypothetical protein
MVFDSSLGYQHHYIPISLQNSLLCLVNEISFIFYIEQLFVYAGTNHFFTLF